MPRTYAVIDADGHVLEPLDLWDRYMDPAYRDRAPQVVTSSRGEMLLALGELAMDIAGSARAGGFDSPPQSDGWEEEVHEALTFLRGADYFFLRCSMAAAKVLADAAGGVVGSSLVTAMTISCREYAIRVSGLGERWFRGPLPTVEAKLFEGFTADDIQWIGGESHITETVGLGGFAQAAAFGLQAYQGGGPEAMIANNLAMYGITHGEHPEFRVPYLGFRGTPTGIDVHKVAATGVVPVIDGGLAGKDGGQIGAGILKAPLACFAAASAALRDGG